MMEGGGGGGGGVRRSPPSWGSILRKERKFSADFNFSSSQQPQQQQQPSVFDSFNNKHLDKNSSNGENNTTTGSDAPPTPPKKNKDLRLTEQQGTFSSNNISQAIDVIGEDQINVMSAYHRRASFEQEDHNHHHHQLASVIVGPGGVLECRGISNGSNSSGGCSRSSSTISVCSSGGGRSSVSPLSEDLSLALLMRSTSDESATPGVQDLSLRGRTSQEEDATTFGGGGVRCRDIRCLLEVDDDELPQDLSLKNKTEPKIFTQEVEDLSVKRRKFTPPLPLAYDHLGRGPMIAFDFSDRNLPVVSLPLQERRMPTLHYDYSSFDDGTAGGVGRDCNNRIEVKILQVPPSHVVNGSNSGSSRRSGVTAEGDLMIVEDVRSTESKNSVIQCRRSSSGAVVLEPEAVYSPVEEEEPQPESSMTSARIATPYENSSAATTTTSLENNEPGGVARRKRGRRRKDEMDTAGEGGRSFDCFLCPFTGSKEAVLVAHLNRMHTVKGNRGSVRCTVCAYSAPTVEDLRVHQEQAHSLHGSGGSGGGEGVAGEEMKVAFHACHHCSKKFRSEAQREAHLRLIAQKQVWKELKARSSRNT